MNGRPHTPDGFIAHIAQVTDAIAGAPLDRALEARLNSTFPAESEWFADAKAWCLRGCKEGWLCAREAGGIRYGRAAPASDLLHGMSIDVVEMTDVVGPHHGHPHGEVDLVIPLEGDPAFDGQPAGWKVYGQGSAHCPTVSGGTALVLYLLPGGAIEFTRG